MIASYAYSPYGIETTLSQAGKNQATKRFGFDGQLTDPTTGWQFLGKGYRAYNPLLHRFMSQDSMSPFEKGGINGYVFANNNPIMKFDPSGHASVESVVTPLLGVLLNSAAALVSCFVFQPIGILGAISDISNFLGLAVSSVGNLATFIYPFAKPNDTKTADKIASVTGITSTVLGAISLVTMAVSAIGIKLSPMFSGPKYNLSKFMAMNDIEDNAQLELLTQSQYDMRQDTFEHLPAQSEAGNTEAVHARNTADDLPGFYQFEAMRYKFTADKLMAMQENGRISRYFNDGYQYLVASNNKVVSLEEALQLTPRYYRLALTGLVRV